MIGGHSRGLPIWREMRWREMFRDTMREVGRAPSFLSLSRDFLTLSRQLDKVR